MARTADRPHDPFAPPVPAFPTNRLRSAGLSDRRLINLADRFDEMSTEAARKFVNRVRTRPTREIAEWFAPPVGDDIEAIADDPRDRLVWLAASYGQPISGNRHDLARLVILGREIEAASDVLTATIDPADYPDADDLAAALDAVVPNQADGEGDEAYLDRLRAAAPQEPPVEVPAGEGDEGDEDGEDGQDGQDGPAEGEGTPEVPEVPADAPAADTDGQDAAPTETDPAGDPIDPAAPTEVAPEGTPDVPAETPATDPAPTEDAPAKVSDAPAEGTDEAMTETPQTETPGETPEAVQGDAPAPVEGDAPIAVEGDTVTAVTGDASPEVSASMTAAAPAEAAAPAPAKSTRKARAR